MRLIIVFAFVALSAIGCNAFWHLHPKIKGNLEKRFPKKLNEKVDKERALNFGHVVQRLDNFNIQNPNTWSNVNNYV